MAAKVNTKFSGYQPYQLVNSYVSDPYDGPNNFFSGDMAQGLRRFY
jgi:hypothetical protein